MKSNFKPGDYVVWQWAGSIAHGEVQEVHESRVEIESRGKRIARNGSHDNPAIIIQHKNGSQVLKLASELQKASSEEV